MRSSPLIDHPMSRAAGCGPSFSFAGQSWQALPQGALFWQERAALIVADLHFEKASAFARRGQMLPPYDSRATLDALTAVIALTQPREIWCLGDSFHDGGAHERMSGETRARIAQLTATYRWTWITGNHDPLGASGVDSPLGGENRAEALVDGVILRHEAMPGEVRPEISGHFHPKLRMSLRGRHISRRCFVKGGSKIIVPAFGAFTGGLDAASPAIASLVGRNSEALIALEDRLLRFALWR
ncbi:DNA ligase-associated metallophosphoesterase [Sphingobium sp. B11D3B]|uniref:ligase-associated DNA damage response endonuclease PdeM n=1 Tax=Sphingobium sp. B11D3B TaxID=2940575 RepID=UPI0039B567AD|nr:DNA ligase-associated metallophosphoesterase [Sphingobium sp. B11D3B]